MSYGFASHIGIGQETTWGTPVAAADYFEALSESLATQRDRFETKNIVGAYYEPDDSVGVERTEGDLVLAVHPENIGHILKGVFGQNSVSSLAANFNQNVFTPRQSDFGSLHPLPPFTLEIFRAGTVVNSSFQYDGVQFRSLQLNVTPNQDLRATAGAIARRAQFINKTTPSYPGSPTEVFLYDTCSLTLAGVANTKIENLTISIDNQLEGIPALNNSQFIQKVRRTGPPLVRVSGTIDFQDLTEYLDFQNQTERELSAHFFKANSFSLFLEVPRFVYTAVPVAASGRGRITSDFQGIARYNTGSGHAIKATLTTVTSY